MTAVLPVSAQRSSNVLMCHQMRTGKAMRIQAAPVCQTGLGIIVKASLGNVTLSVLMDALAHMMTSALAACHTHSGRFLVRSVSAIQTGGCQTAHASVGHATQLAGLMVLSGVQVTLILGAILTVMGIRP